jgi:hypothetical protein
LEKKFFFTKAPILGEFLTKNRALFFTKLLVTLVGSVFTHGVVKVGSVFTYYGAFHVNPFGKLKKKSCHLASVVPSYFFRMKKELDNSFLPKNLETIAANKREIGRPFFIILAVKKS